MRLSQSSSETSFAPPMFKPEPLPSDPSSQVGTPPPEIEVRRYVKPDGWVTRYWAVYISGELLAVVVYKKGAQAIAARLQ